jgi:gliding motility-associated-like protein
VCRVKPLTFYVTTAINPNSSNNRFVVKGEGIDKGKSEFLIYNRWGELISKGNLNQEWNGEYKNKKVSSGIYMYVVKVYGINGEYKQGKGTVNVIR